jgi:carbonic anhydrase/acetyltransferase-like protein (isoleucine patch superfamily)
MEGKNMLYRNHAGDKPVVASTATIHPSAVVIGNVHIDEKVFVGLNAVIRADEPCPEGKVEAIVIDAEVG